MRFGSSSQGTTCDFVQTLYCWCAASTEGRTSLLFRESVESSSRLNSCKTGLNESWNAAKSRGTTRALLLLAQPFRTSSYGGKPARLPGWAGRRDSFRIVFIRGKFQPVCRDRNCKHVETETHVHCLDMQSMSNVEIFVSAAGMEFSYVDFSSRLPRFRQYSDNISLSGLAG